MTIMVAVATIIGFIVLVGGLLLVHRSVYQNVTYRRLEVEHLKFRVSDSDTLVAWWCSG